MSRGPRVSPVTSPKRERGQGGDEDTETNFSYSPMSSAVMSPSKSNVNMDLYTGSPSSHGSRRSTDSSLRDPPPPYSSPSKSAVSNNSGSRFSSLMQFLDKEIESSTVGVSAGGGAAKNGNGSGNDIYGDVDNTSTVSDLSPSSKTRHPDDTRSFGSKSLFAGKSYIWDDDMPGHGLESGVGDSSKAYGVVSEGDAATYFSQQSAATSFGSSKDLGEMVSKIKQKVEHTRSELREATNRAKELQSELVRVNAARKRRANKVRSEWEQKLEKQREEQDKSLKRLKDFVSRLQKETDDLKKKRDSLEERKNKIGRSREQTLRLLQEDIERKAAQTRRQWHVEEKAVFEKALSQRIEAIKKAAAESFGPQMDKMVEDGKLELRKREDAISGRLEQYRIQLQSELERKLAMAKDAMREQLKNEEDRARRHSERKLEEALRTQGEEMAAVKTKYNRDKKILEENIERMRRLNAESALDAMREVRQAENKEVMELMAANQRELAQISRKNAEQLKQAELHLAEEEKEHLRQVSERMEQQLGAQKERARMSAKAQAEAETERVLERLRADVEAERRRVKEAIDKDLDDLRLSAHASLEAKHSQEKRMVERIATMKGEVESQRKEVTRLEEAQKDKKDELVDAKNRLSALRTELKQVEEEVENTELRNNEELNQHQRQASREYQQLLEEEASAKEALHREEVAAANRKDDAIAMYAADLTRIRDKVGALLKRKDDTARTLRQQLSALQEKSSELQDKLDSLRAEQYARVTTSVDADVSSGDGETQDILTRLNIGNIDPESGRRSTASTRATSNSSVGSRNTTTTRRERERRVDDEYSFRV